MIFEGGDHGLREFRDEMDRAVEERLDRYVRDGDTWPSLEPHGDYSERRSTHPFVRKCSGSRKFWSAR